jgi:hypothetical protein
VKVDPFIEAEKVAGHNVAKACELLEVSRAAFYQRRSGAPSKRDATDAELLEQIRAIHQESKGTYGAPRIHKELLHRHVACGKRKVTRLMRQAGLEGRCKKRWRKTTVADPGAEAARDLIQRHFGPGPEMDRRYVGDITYISTWEGWAYLATVIDLASRRVVGWALADHMRTELVEDALTMAFDHRAPEEGVIFHSDRGCQGNTRAVTSPTSLVTTASSSRFTWPSLVILGSSHTQSRADGEQCAHDADRGYRTRPTKQGHPGCCETSGGERTHPSTSG